MKIVKKTLSEIADIINAQVKGDPGCVVTGIATLQDAGEGQLSFLDNQKYRRFLASTRASAVIIKETDVIPGVKNALIVDDPYFAYSQIAQEFADLPVIPIGVHPSAVIGQDCIIDSTASIGPNVVIGDHVSISARVQIGAGCVIDRDCRVGQDCRLWANVTLYYCVQLGDRVIIHSGAVLGADGFGIAQHEGRWHKIPQLGGVIIEDDVEIGANTTIDRGALNDTVIESGVKLDNQIQIGHNVRIGSHTVIAGCVGVAGSTTIGKNCMIGGAVGINGHVEIADRVVITAMSGVTNSIKEPGVYSSGWPCMKNRDFNKGVARFRQLNKVTKIGKEDE